MFAVIVSLNSDLIQRFLGALLLFSLLLYRESIASLKSSGLSHRVEADGSSGESRFGSFKSDWMEIKTVRTSYRAVHLSCFQMLVHLHLVALEQTFKISRQMFPSESMFGWKHRVMKRTTGDEYG